MHPLLKITPKPIPLSVSNSHIEHVSLNTFPPNDDIVRLGAPDPKSKNGHGGLELKKGLLTTHFEAHSTLTF
jgi:hypothetical protein